MKNNLESTSKERDNLKEEVLRYRISAEEKEKNSRLFDDQVKLLGQYGEVDSNFSKFLNIMKNKGDSGAWAKIDFLEKMNQPLNNNPELLLKEIERLKIEKGVLGNELDKTKSLLQIQQQINEDQQKLFDEDKKILKFQYEKALNKIEELSKLVDIERLPKNKTAQQFYKTNEELIKQGLMTEDLREFKDFKDITKAVQLVDHIPDDITEFSVNEGDADFTMSENALDIWVGKGFLEKGLEKELGFPISGLISFLAVDFYLHETQTSNMNNGMNPLYNLQLTFKINVDEHFIHFLESDYILIDLYYMSNNLQFPLGHGKIPLSLILDNEENIKQDLLNTQTSKVGNKMATGMISRVVHGAMSIFYDKDPNISIGKIHYKMRMRNPILETIKFYREKDKVLREISPMHDLFSKKVEKEIAQLGGEGKNMLVTIMISKAANLKVSGPLRKIAPYLYYQFYKFDDHYSDSTYGENPTFGLVDKYNVIYDNTFHTYIENQYLEILVLDDSNALEVQVSADANNMGSVNLIDNKDEDDLIGVVKINLKDLLISNLVQGGFPIINRKNQIAGEIFVNVFWEEVALGGEDPNADKPFENKNWERDLLKKLADLIKHKGLNLNSTFKLLDTEEKNIITVDDFKNFVQWNIKFTEKQRDLQELVECVFGNKKVLSKRDFYKAFAYLLPHEGPIENMLNDDVMASSVNVIKRHADENKIVESTSLSFIGGEEKHPQPKPRESRFSSKDMHKKVTHQDTKKSLANQQSINIVPDKSEGRELKDIVFDISEYLRKHSRMTIVDFFKRLDIDGNSFIDQKVK